MQRSHGDCKAADIKQQMIRLHRLLKNKSLLGFTRVGLPYTLPAVWYEAKVNWLLENNEVTILA